jgi:predicted Zn-dependent protease
VALAQTKDNAKAADDFARALKQGSEEPTTFLNLATALENLGKGQEAEAVLERGVAAYPYSGPLTARLARQYVMDGQAWRARNLVEKYRTLFPEDSALREVQSHLEAASRAGDLTAPMRTAPLTTPQ